MKEPSEKADRLANLVIGAAIEVHRELGPGLDELIYENAIDVELRLRGIPFKRQPVYNVLYKEEDVGTKRLDMMVDDELVLEMKSVEKIIPLFQAQVRGYLKITKKELGLLINFNVPLLKDGIQRIVLTQ